MRLLIATAAAFAVIGGYPAFAQEANAEKDAVRIEMDQEARAFVFIIDDEPVAMLDKSGLHVPGEINYGLYLTDTGPDSIKKRIASQQTEAADD